MTMAILQCSFIAPEDHHLVPLMTYSSPSRRISHWMLVASEEATSGSVMEKQERISPASSGLSHFSFCMTEDRKSTRLNSSHVRISYAVFCLKKKKQQHNSCKVSKTQHQNNI